MRYFIFILLLVPLCAYSQSNPLERRSSSIEAQIKDVSAQSAHQKQSAELPPPLPIDTILTPEVPFTPLAVSMHGYDKALNDAHESFLLRNETQRYRISRVLLKLVYTTESGVELHRREEYVECDLQPGATQVVTIKSFDKNKNYYYYTTPPKRASGTPYRVKYNILRYDIVVE